MSHTRATYYSTHSLIMSLAALAGKLAAAVTDARSMPVGSSNPPYGMAPGW
jgi:hypothetical protein